MLILKLCITIQILLYKKIPGHKDAGLLRAVIFRRFCKQRVETHCL